MDTLQLYEQIVRHNAMPSTWNLPAEELEHWIHAREKSATTKPKDKLTKKTQRSNFLDVLF